MTELTLDGLLTLLRECAGADESIDLSGDVLDAEFGDLGYDSLALFNTVGRIERDYEVRLPEDFIDEVRTPRDLLKLVNEALL